jgi:hypothetical protein
VSIDGIPYHTQELELDLKEYIKRTLGVSEEIDSTDPLMKNHVRIQQLISDMNMQGSGTLSNTQEQLYGYGLL